MIPPVVGLSASKSAFGEAYILDDLAKDTYIFTVIVVALAKHYGTSFEHCVMA
jgi:hypothetical protein